MTEAEKFCEENNVKFRLSNIGENIGVVALEYINMLEKEIDSYKALDSHYEEIEEDAKAIAKENEELKEVNEAAKQELIEARYRNSELQKKLDFFLTETVAGKEYRPKEELVELEKENAELVKELMHLKGCKTCTDRPKGKLATVCATEYEDHCIAQKMTYIKELQEEIKKLKERLQIESQSLHEQCEIASRQVAQIEKMKCCGNCGKRGSECIAQEIQGIFCGKEKAKWELAE